MPYRKDVYAKRFPPPALLAGDSYALEWAIVTTENGPFEEPIDPDLDSSSGLYLIGLTIEDHAGVEVVSATPIKDEDAMGVFWFTWSVPEDPGSVYTITLRGTFGGKSQVVDKRRVYIAKTTDEIAQI